MDELYYFNSVIFLYLSYRYKRKTKTALPRIFLKRAGRKSHYSVTVGEKLSRDNLDNSLPSAIDELVEETSMQNNEVDREDGENYQEAPQLLGKYFKRLFLN